MPTGNDIQKLIDDWKEVQRKKFQVEEQEREVLDRIKVVSRNIEGKTITLLGETEKIKLRPRSNVSYAKTNQGHHPLLEIIQQHPDHASLVRTSYAESGSKIKDLLARFEEPHFGGLTPEEIEIANTLMQHRQTKEGKPTISIESMKEDELVSR